MLEAANISCPYCGEIFEATIDVSGGSQQYIEDCFVCCRPIQFNVVLDVDGNLESVIVARDDD